MQKKYSEGTKFVIKNQNKTGQIRVLPSSA